MRSILSFFENRNNSVIANTPNKEASILDLKNLEKNEQALLHQLVQAKISGKSESFLYGDVEYPVDSNQTIKFFNSLWIMKENNKEIRIEVLQKIGGGYNSLVFLNIGDLIVDDGGLIYQGKTPESQRVFKIITDADHFAREADIIKHVPHLEAKIISRACRVISYQYFPGDTLEQLFESWESKEPDVAEKALLCQKIYNAWYEQVYECRLVHRDLSPRNIVVTQSGAVYIIDYDSGKLLNERKKVTGITYYCALPEHLYSVGSDNHDETTVATDLRALALIFSRIFGVEPFFTPWFDKFEKQHPTLKPAWYQYWYSSLIKKQQLSEHEHGVIHNLLDNLAGAESGEALYLQELINEFPEQIQGISTSSNYNS